MMCGCADMQMCKWWGRLRDDCGQLWKCVFKGGRKQAHSFMRFYLHNFRQPSGKLFFPAGWLALGLFPLLGCQLFFSDPCFRTQHCIEIAYASPRLKENPSSNLISDADTTFILKGTTEERQKQLKNIRAEALRRRGFSCNNRVLKVHFDEQTSWQDFIGLLDVFRGEGFRVYQVEGQDVCLRTNAEIRISKAEKRLRERIELKKEKLSLMSCGGMYHCGTGRGREEQTASIDKTIPLLHSNRGIAFLSAAGVLVLLNTFSLFRKKELPYSIPVSRIGK